MTPLNASHDPARTSWVKSAKDHSCFPIQNLPFGVAQQEDGTKFCVVAIGDMALNVSKLAEQGALGEWSSMFIPGADFALNRFMAAGQEAWSEVRLRLSNLLCQQDKDLEANRDLLSPMLIAINDLSLCLPAQIGDYTDFYTSYHHALNCGRVSRPDRPLQPSFWHMPIGYHGRASTVKVSGTSVKRPKFQLVGEELQPRFEHTQKLDYEFELGFFVGSGNALGEPIDISDIDQHLFGAVILNDWSARDAQRWEKMGSGSLMSKNFLTSISPWIVTMEALAPYRKPLKRPAEAATLLDYLVDEKQSQSGAIAIQIETSLQTAEMTEPQFLAKANFADQAFTIGQIVTHHASNGCQLQAGDLIASGTISGAGRGGTEGCLMEMTEGGTKPLELANGETRAYLEDGDQVIMRARCAEEGFVPIGFGECRGTVIN